jgi:hypothetical protein
MDTLRFQSAEQAYNRGDCVRARNEVGEYLSNYPNGAFHLYARLIRAQCARSMNQRILMYEDLEDLVARPSHPYTESVLRMLAEERAADSSWQQSAEAWKKWGSRMTAPQDIQEALKGQMIAWVKLENWTELEKAASRILEMESVPEALRTDAHIAKALCLMEASRLSDAQTILEKVYASNKNEPGATALYTSQTSLTAREIMRYASRVFSKWPIEFRITTIGWAWHFCFFRILILLRKIPFKPVQLWKASHRVMRQTT